MPHWKYRAYDHENKIHDGIAESDNFVSLAVKIRERGLQILDAEILHPNDKLAMQRLERLKNKINSSDNKIEPTRNSNDKDRIRRLLSLFISLFRRLKRNDR